MSPTKVVDAKMVPVSLYGKGTVAGDTPLLLDASGRIIIGKIVQGVDDQYRAWSAEDRNGDNTLPGTIGAVALWTFNGSTWDRFRNNVELTLIASGNYSSTQFSPDQTNYNHRGVIAWIDITAVPGTDTVTLAVQGKDPTSGKYYTLGSDSARSTTGLFACLVYPGVTDTQTIMAGESGLVLPRTWRVRVSHSGTGTFTYSVGACLIL